MARVGFFLKDKREATGLNQREVADQLGYTTPQYVSNWERGLIYPPTEKLGFLVNLYKIPKDELIALMVEEYQGYLKATIVEGMKK